jgi:hypothetical protein
MCPSSDAGYPRQGHVDHASGKECGWACGAFRCDVPGCEFSDARCIIVLRQRRQSSAETLRRLEDSSEWLVDRQTREYEQEGNEPL